MAEKVARRAHDGLLPALIVFGSWMSGPGILVGWTLILALYGRDWFGSLVVPSYLVMYKLQSRYLRTAFWICVTAVSATNWLRLGFAITVWIVGAGVLLDFRLPGWPGFVECMDKRWRFKSFVSKCELKGNLESISPEKTVFAFHPHGAISFGFTVNGLFDLEFVSKSKHLSFLIDEFLRYGNPLFRYCCDLYSCNGREVTSADKDNVQRLMSEGRNIALTLGGFEEATHCEMGKDRVVVLERKGIIKHCLRHGYKIHPVYSFGEDETFFFAQGCKDFRLRLNKMKIPTVAFFGHPIISFLPRHQAKIMTFVGDAIQCPHTPEPTSKEVDEWHKRYVDALVALFDAKKAEAGRPDAKLEVF
eukprot:TRINITY_DN71164_c0_g1_i1.p1 TRINITY_DN71164_c0_g1~~TRINITY_DN71164_c0_g1_i1.p1  ORF type:complete len:361 (+),score=60.10 TRINITY_DN71164_c0_g1_i1:63-1145(+)